MQKSGFLLVISCFFVFGFFSQFTRIEVHLHSAKQAPVKKFILPLSAKSLFFGEEPKKSYRLRDAELEFNRNNSKYLELLGFDDFEPINVTNGLPDVTLITALSDDHFGEARRLILNVNKVFPKRKLVVYGLNLKPRTKNWIKKACNVIYRDFNFTRYPELVWKPSNYRFKALVVSEALMEFGAIFWTDTSSIWKGNFSELISDINRQNTTLSDPHVFMIQITGHSNYAVTHPQVYRYLPAYNNETLRTFEQYGSGKMIFYRTRPTIDLVLKWFVLCSLEPDCLFPKGTTKRCKFQKDRYGTRANPECHRYDQSAINLILSPFPKSFPPYKWSDKYILTERRNNHPSEKTNITCT